MRRQAPLHTLLETVPLASLELLDIMLVSREADKREAILFRQGRAKFQLPGAGHEAVAAISYALEQDDIIYPYYRDRALMLARGTPLSQLALDYFAKEKSTSGGRQMASHYCDRDHNMVSCATPTGMQCLPAVGTAWGIKLAKRNQVVVCCIGDASTRQGEFYEALCFAFQEKLPIVFVVEDNAYGISTATKNMTPYGINVLSSAHSIHVDGRDPQLVYEAAIHAVSMARMDYKPSVIWLDVDRLMSHTSSDDQRTYRTREELSLIESRDPLVSFANNLIAQGLLQEEQWEKKCRSVVDNVCAIYEEAEKAADPDIYEIKTHIFSDKKLKPALFSPDLRGEKNMAEVINASLQLLLTHNEKIILFGEDIADPKGGVFGLTKRLSTSFPGRVFNSPLAEATICGVAAGLSLTGNHLPVFELQFIDFVGTAFNQMVNQIATMRWRTMGRYSCPMVILAPCGGYLGCGGPWHSQTNEAWFAHAPGLKIAMPSTPDDAAEIIIAAAYSEDPTLVLLPKNLFFKRQPYSGIPSLYPDQPKIRRAGKDLTLVAWGNCVDLALETAAEADDNGCSVEIIDPRYIAPFDISIIISSLLKTGRLLIVQEDVRTCSFGQHLMAECMSKPEVWKALVTSPQLIAREDVHVGFHGLLEHAVLPQKTEILQTIFNMMGAAT